MNTGGGNELQQGFETLRRFVSKRLPAERCEFCSLAVASSHAHLYELRARRLVCVCPPCALLFGKQSGSKYKAVPTRVRLLGSFRMADAVWEGLLIPIGLAFFSRSSVAGRVEAFYPSPAGATESQLAMEQWAEVERGNPVLAEMEEDVEALLVNRVGHARGGPAPEHYLLPIDECFRLVGIIRSRWKGLSGGPELWQEIAGYFAELRSRAGEPEGADA